VYENNTPDDDYQWPTCTACARQLRHDELGRVACHICRDRAEQNLTALAGEHGLYARLSACLAPGAPIRDGHAPTGRTAPLPLRLAPLSLSARGGVVTVLQTWLIDWHETLGWNHPRWSGGLQGQLDQVVGALRSNLDWAASAHLAFGEFADELSSLVRACRRQVTGEQPERRIAVECPCGGILRITVSTPGTRCAACSAQYDRIAVLELPLAERAVAA
jgi:hypothetical protein